MQNIFTNEYFMKQALMQAKIASDKNEVPVGAVIVFNNKIIAKAHNLTETLKDATAHAEMLAITSAANMLGAKYLKKCTLYVTAEPCVMCAGASYWSQIGKIVYGAKDNKRGFSNFNKKITHPQTEIISGIMEFECSEIITDFFQKIRKA